MPVYVDNARIPFGPRRAFGQRLLMCHMIADSLDELHHMASLCGLRQEWFQEKASTPHYDLSLSKRDIAIRYGAVYVPTNREVAALLKRLRADRAEALAMIDG